MIMGLFLLFIKDNVQNQNRFILRILQLSGHHSVYTTQQCFITISFSQAKFITDEIKSSSRPLRLTVHS